MIAMQPTGDAVHKNFCGKGLAAALAPEQTATVPHVMRPFADAILRPPFGAGSHFDCVAAPDLMAFRNRRAVVRGA
ncbi:hypothetical protein [Ponticoccus alexandrii]|uniref:Uncharacterized protein n=1 Tax=Ponticoccus alexandrii TaxID=1943633 RepID=A0ABX7F911_9RHOB|nr:hypothetical protein [Ponticoccus alexandrii]ETA52915.1 hypothetical protein P279_06240 [Rhodobacteraceae bacterium PD-2]QRF66883.1 hypothetical protein GQA70_11510 [Ponticoccus alexandrii]